MGVADLMSSSNVDELRYDRENRLHPPEYPPGQSPSDYSRDVFGGVNSMDGFSQLPPIGGSSMGGSPMGGGMMGGNPMGGNPLGGSPMGGSSMGGSPFSAGLNSPLGQSPVNNGGLGSSMGSVFNTGIGGMTPSLNGMPMMQQQQPQQPPKDAADKFWDGAKAAGVGTKNFLSGFGSGLSGLTTMFWYKYCAKLSVVGAIQLVLSMLLGILGAGVIGRKMAIGGAVMCLVSVPTFMLLKDSASKCSGLYKDDFEQPQQPVEPQGFPQSNDLGMMNNSFDDFSSGGDDTNFFNSGFDDDYDDGVVEDDDYQDDDDLADWDEIDAELNSEPDEGMDKEEALRTMQDVPKGMYTRQYLWDAFVKVLPSIKPDFAEMKVVDEDEDAFYYWSEKLQEAAEVAGCKEEFLPELTSLEENLFTIRVISTRPTGFKPDAVATELANIYAYKDGSFSPGVYGKAEVNGKSCIITIFTGVSALISVRDMMEVEKDFFLEAKNYMPVVLGVDPLGKVIHADLRKVESIIITGMPRSGKSWFVQAVLTQMCAFVSPRELWLYMCDPKGSISDFKRFCLPHVKKFVSEDAKIVDTLRQVVKVEAPRRKKIIGDAGFVNIWDFKGRYPDVDLPIIYVVVDEIVTLASRMDKDTGIEFRMLLRELISQLPALGIRAFFIPHVLNNDIFEKKTSDMVECKVSVKGDADHIERATGSKFKDFPYRLSNMGDMAVRMPVISPNTMFVHGPALTDSNEKNIEMFDYMRRMWTKLEPECCEGSVVAEAAIEADNNKLLNDAFSAPDDDFDLFGSDNSEPNADYRSAETDFIRNMIS